MNIIEKTFTINGTLTKRSKTDAMFLHHAAATNCSVEDIDRWHKQNGWCCIGYHFLVRKDGQVYRGRQEDAVGAHAYGYNSTSIGICFEGNFDQEQMTEAQVQAGKELVAYLKNKYGISKVLRHSDVNKTSCPGANFRFDEIANGTVVEIPATPAEGKIATIQRTVNERYGFNIDVDNIFGNETKRALVKALQTELNTQLNKGLDVDGIFGSKTKGACINVRKGAKGNITWLIQAMLVCKGYDISVDGDFGYDTDKAVRDFQSRNGLSADGICGKNTFEKLFR